MAKKDPGSGVKLLAGLVLPAAFIVASATHTGCARTAGGPSAVDGLSLGKWGEKHGLETGVIKRIGDTDVVLGCYFSTVYVSKNVRDYLFSNEQSFGVFFPVGYRTANGEFADPVSGFVPVNGNPQKFQYTSSNTAIVKPYEDGGAVFLGAGKVTITLHVAGDSIPVDLTVVELPVITSNDPEALSLVRKKHATTAEEALQLLGFPDEKTEHRIGTAQHIDGIYYDPKPNTGIHAEHWKYKKYPGAVISVATDNATKAPWVWCVRTWR